MSRDRKKQAIRVLEMLRRRYPEPESDLTWKTPWELLVATVLAAQCTDKRVNTVTPELFSRWPGPCDMAGADIGELEEVIHSTGFFRQKAKNLKAAGRMVCDDFGGEPPRTMAELVTLPGVARKTANIVLSNGYDLHEGIAVDTHVRRLSYRLDLTDSTNPQVIEKDLMPLFPQDSWGEINHLLVLFGRYVCVARKPRCEECELADVCPRRGV